MYSNPFEYGNPIAPSSFLGRRQSIRKIVGRIVNRGQSTAVVGDPRSGKTSLFKYLASSDIRGSIFGTGASMVLIGYIDAQVLGTTFSTSDFWRHALKPLADAVSSGVASMVRRELEVCEQNRFGTFTLERLLNEVRAAGLQIVVFVDEFDVLLEHAELSSAEFFGGLRSVASRSEGALALVIGSRLPLGILNTRAKGFARGGSPYFNIFAETTLGPLLENERRELLARGGTRFSDDDRAALVELAGGLPFLLQAAAAALWDAYEDGSNDPIDRRRRVAREIFQEHDSLFRSCWSNWSPLHRMALTAIGLVTISQPVRGRPALPKSFLDRVGDYGPELRDLETTGYVVEDQEAPGGFRVQPRLVLWWLSEDLIRASRADATYDEWLRDEELSEFLAPRERARIASVLRSAAHTLNKGVVTLIDLFASGEG